MGKGFLVAGIMWIRAYGKERTHPKCEMLPERGQM